MPGEAIAMILGLGLTAIVIVVFVVTFIVIGKKARAQMTQQEYAARYRAKQQAEETAAKQQLSASEKHQLHQDDAARHQHLGEEEHYQEIVGSLGEVNDEGCADLDGVRFIARDIASEVGDDESVDYTKLVQAMVLGEILNTPRFKNPYSRK